MQCIHNGMGQALAAATYIYCFRLHKTVQTLPKHRNLHLKACKKQEAGNCACVRARTCVHACRRQTKIVNEHNQ